jgi:hypothetical protein
MITYQYKLKYEYIPDGYEVSKELSERDKKIGGIKLLYEVAEINTSTTKINKKLRVFLKPFKQYWELDKKSCNYKEDWGSDLVNISGVWLELVNDYDNILEEDLIDFIRVKNTQLLGMLNRRNDLFVIEQEQNKQIIATAITPKELKLSQINNKIEKIFRNLGITYVIISTNILKHFKTHEQNNIK